MIYILEDDSNIRKLIAYTLSTGGMESEGFATPSAFFEAVRTRLPKLILLDIMLPEEDGLSVLAKLRRDPSTAAVPVMILTAKSSEFDKVIGLDSGADDYMTKPFGMMEMLSRVRALLRRSEGKSGTDTLYTAGPLTVSPAHHTVHVGEESISLSLKEFKLLCLLLEKGGAVVSREEISNTVWGYSFDGESRTVDVHIRNLRQKLGAAGTLIETVKGIGYKIAEP